MSGWWGVALLATLDASLWIMAYRDRRPSAAERRLWAHAASTAARAHSRSSLREGLGRAVLRILAARLRRFGSAARRRRDADRLVQAGVDWDPALLDVLRLGGAAVGLAAGAIAGWHGRVAGGPFVWAALAGGLGYLSPGVWVGQRGAARTREFQRALPDALDVLAICLRAGLGFHAAVAEYTRSVTGVAGDAFRRYLADLALGQTPEDGLAEMIRRYPGDDLAVVASGLAQAIRLGSPLAQILEEQAAHFRMVALRQAEEGARRLSTRLVLPLVAFIFPQVFIVGLGPVALRLFGPGGLLK
jgi:tight adherence protein C